ncbi:MAG: MlaD family protein [Gammaproteobacteria bacterium]|nr:MlaD family protein [Gammaproteobacteria bacterium]
MNNNESETMDQEQFARPKVSAKKSFSPVWILPIVALLIGLGLIAKSFLNAGIMITLKVPSAEGIEVGKTQVLYKGITAGVVKERDVTDDMQHVILHIEMDKRTAPFLNENAKFWVVEPRVSLSGVSGLDTILGGRYIAVKAEDTGIQKRNFIALSVPPPPSDDAHGLHIKLRLHRLASVGRGTVIYYKQIPVGDVTNYTLEENDTEIHAWVLIKPEYAHLIKENSHFYNVSGIKINAGLSGVQIETESLISVLAGGIAFYTPRTKEESKPAKHGAFYLLYDDFESAKIGIPVILRFKNIEKLQENRTQIKFQGQKIGTLGKIRYDKENHEAIVVASINPLFEDVLTENTQFWVVKPSMSLLKISGLDALIQGNYIEMRPAAGKSKREFYVSDLVPPLSDSVPGLHIYIETDALGSITKDVPLYYKNIPVGNIEGFELTRDAKKVRLNAFIKPEFAHLVTNNTRFYNVSGLNIQAGVSGIKIKTESLASLVSGGIAFYTPTYAQESQNTQAPGKNGDTFELYKDFDDAKAGIEISLIFDTATGLSEGFTKVIYKGLVLGVVRKITPNNEKQTVTASVILDPIAEGKLVEDTRFWMVKPKISISGIQHLETFLSGDYITLRIGSSKKKRTSFNVTQTKPPLDNNYPGLHLKINSSELGSISIGSPVMYQRIKIGDVQDYELARDRKSINLLIHIWPQYKDLVTPKSRFYNASGIQIDASLASVEIRTESIESILNGGIALYNGRKVKPGSTRAKRVTNGTLYKLFKDYEAARKNAFYVRVQFMEPKGLSFGSEVKYRGIDVGEVDSIVLNEKKADSVWVMLELDSALKPLLGKESEFWVSKARLGLARTENLDTIIKGSYINVQPVKGKLTDFFIGLEEKPLVHQIQHGFTVSLTASRLSSVKTGDPVYYRQVKVGTVVGYELADTADQILIYLNIRNRFKPLIRENTKFWHASGVAIDISIFGTSKIRTESLEAILSGGITFATPDNDIMGKMLPSGSFFVLHDEPKPEWTQWNPIIHLKKETQQD